MAKEKHGMHYTLYRGLGQVFIWVRLKFAAMNLKKLARWKAKRQSPLLFPSIFRPLLPLMLCGLPGFSQIGRFSTGCAKTSHYIRSRGEEKKGLDHNPNFRARRWVVEVIHSFFNRFRKRLVRFEKKTVNYITLLHFACAVIVWRKLIRPHR